MTDPAEHFEEFEELWGASRSRAESMPEWSELTLEEMKVRSSKVRRDLEAYSRENPMGNRMGGGLYGSPSTSNEAG